MVDKMGEMAYNKCAEVNKAITCGDFLFSHLLSHFRQFNTFGGRTPGFTFHTRATPAFRFLASATESDVKSGAFSFLPNNETAPGATNTQGRNITRLKRSLEMRRESITQSSFDANQEDFSNFSEAELSALLDLLTSQIEYHREELIRLKPILHRLQDRIPNSPFTQFINNELEIPGE
jgi:hypothetical protein